MVVRSYGTITKIAPSKLQSMQHTSVEDLLKGGQADTIVMTKGWVRTRRGNKNVAFIAVNDGSTIHNIQVVADPSKFEEVLKKVATGACIGAKGMLVRS